MSDAFVAQAELTASRTEAEKAAAAAAAERATLLERLEQAEGRAEDAVRRALEADVRAADADAVLSQLVGEGLRPRISAVYPLRAVAEALEAVAAGQTVGKVVLEMANAC